MTDIFLLIFFYTFFSDIDECSLKTDNCDSNAVCANTEGNFTCSCKTGFSGDGHFCAGLYCILGKILKEKLLSYSKKRMDVQKLFCTLLFNDA